MFDNRSKTNAAPKGKMMGDGDRIRNALNSISSMRESLSRYSDCESKRAKLSVMRVIESELLKP